MINNVYINKGKSDFYIQDSNNIITKNLPQNIDIFSELVDVNDKVGLKTKNSYYKLLKVIREYLDQIDYIEPIENNLSKLRNYIDEDKEIFIEWVIRNNYRIGFDIDRNGNISFWKIFKNGMSTNTISDVIDNYNFKEKIICLLKEVMNLT